MTSSVPSLSQTARTHRQCLTARGKKYRPRQSIWIRLPQHRRPTGLDSVPGCPDLPDDKAEIRSRYTIRKDTAGCGGYILGSRRVAPRCQVRGRKKYGRPTTVETGDVV